MAIVNSSGQPESFLNLRILLEQIDAPWQKFFQKNKKSKQGLLVFQDIFSKPLDTSTMILYTLTKTNVATAHIFLSDKHNIACVMIKLRIFMHLKLPFYAFKNIILCSKNEQKPQIMQLFYALIFYFRIKIFKVYDCCTLKLASFKGFLQ